MSGKCTCGDCRECLMAAFERATPVEVTVSPNLRIITIPAGWTVRTSPRTWGSGGKVTILDAP